MRSGLLLLLFPLLLCGQSDTATLSGQISDPSGAAVVGAKITLQNRATGSRRAAASDVTVPTGSAAGARTVRDHGRGERV